MSAIAVLFTESPCAGWIAVAGLLLCAELASGRARLTCPAIAALAPALLAGVQAPGGLAAEGAVFAGLGLALSIAFAPRRRAPRAAPLHGLPTPKAGKAAGSWPTHRRTGAESALKAAAGRRAPAPQGRSARAPAVVGARGRTLGEFCNGVGRVWIDRAEWAAELTQGESLAADHDVEVVGVSGGVRLRVRAVG